MTALIARFTQCDLKKQTQFPKGQIGAKSVLIMVYGILCKRRQQENKVKQSQI
jgi:hypothetical protein